jgi:hypothetical protein
MSLSYASRLTQGKKGTICCTLNCNCLHAQTGVDYGECGLAEKVDTPRVRGRELDKMEKLFREAKFMVMHTGAGISTCMSLLASGLWYNALMVTS